MLEDRPGSTEELNRGADRKRTENEYFLLWHFHCKSTAHVHHMYDMHFTWKWHVIVACDFNSISATMTCRIKGLVLFFMTLRYSRRCSSSNGRSAARGRCRDRDRGRDRDRSRDRDRARSRGRGGEATVVAWATTVIKQLEDVLITLLLSVALLLHRSWWFSINTLYEQQGVLIDNAIKL